jgi:UDP-hydrolysing UDP-N-acetyl-D-glucosamine 2-epimerase
MTEVRRICVVTGTRAEYGILHRLLRKLSTDPRFTLQLAVTGSHLSPEFGLTHRVIQEDGFRIDRRIEILLSSDTPVGISKAVGLAVIGFADAFQDLDPNVVVIIGDRFESLAAAQAAFFAGIPIAHISGGEVTLGALDDGMRHAITKLSRYHFVAAEAYRRRVIQLGETPDTVFNVGDPALDDIARLEFLERGALAASLGLDPAAAFFLTTYHPATAGVSDPCAGLRALLDALDEFPSHQVVFTQPNADAGGRAVARLIDDYAASRPQRVKSFASLGRLRYLSAVKHCAAVVGNSSSGIVEAPALARPTVNIGARQAGRLRAASIIDCEENTGSIIAALSLALSEEFQRQIPNGTPPPGSCDAASEISRLLATLDISQHHAKGFHDLRS